MTCGHSINPKSTRITLLEAGPRRAADPSALADRTATSASGNLPATSRIGNLIRGAPDEGYVAALREESPPSPRPGSGTSCISWPTACTLMWGSAP